jgi:hypothetical protein
MSVVTNNIQLGSSVTATQNFTITAEAANGTMKLARGNAGATTQDIFTVDAAGNITFVGNVTGAGLGSGQTWQNVTASRAINTNYTNTTGRAIQVAVTFSGTNAGIRFYVDGIEVARQSTGVSSGTVWQGVQVVVPAGSTYNATQTFGTLYNWAELS